MLQCDQNPAQCVLDLYLPTPRTSALRFRSIRCRTAPWRRVGFFRTPGGLGLHCRIGLPSCHAPALRQHDNVGEKAVVPDSAEGAVAGLVGIEGGIVSG